MFVGGREKQRGVEEGVAEVSWEVVEEEEGEIRMIGPCVVRPHTEK